MAGAMEAIPQHRNVLVTCLHPSRRQVLRASLVGGIAVYLAPLGSSAFASLFEDELLTRPDWNGSDHSLKFRIDSVSKVTGEKVFARDVWAHDMRPTSRPIPTPASAGGALWGGQKGDVTPAAVRALR